MKQLLMMMMFFTLIVQAGEGQGVGNGGDSIYCSPDKVIFFDLFEAANIYGQKIELGAPELNYLEKIQIVAARNSYVLPYTMNALLVHAESFEERSIFTEKPLVDIPDTGEAILPQGCEIRQTIIRNKAHQTPGKLFLVDKTLWDKLDNDSKAAAVLHEFFYGNAVDSGASNSKLSRHLNSFFMAPPPTKPFLNWTKIALATGAKFIEPWGDAWLNGAVDTISSIATAPFLMDTKNLGKVLIAPGLLCINYIDSDLPKITAAILGEKKLFTNDLIKMNASGNFLANPSIQSNDYTDYVTWLSNGSIDIFQLGNKEIQILFNEECSNSLAYATLTSRYYRDGSKIDGVSLNRISCKNVGIQLIKNKLNIDVPMLTSFNISPNYSSFDALAHKDQLVQLNWFYGTHLVKKLQWKTENWKPGAEKTEINSADYLEVIGTIKNYSIGNSVFPNIDFVGYKEIGSNILRYATPLRELKLNVNRDLVISYNNVDISTDKVKTFSMDVKYKSSLKIDSLFNFPNEFKNPITNFTIIDDKVNKTISIDYVSFVMSDISSFIESIKTQEEGKPWKEVRLDEAFQENAPPLKLKINSGVPEILESCSKYRGPWNYGKKIEIKLTKIGQQKFGKKYFGNKENFELTACFTQAGYTFTDIKLIKE